MTFVVFSHIFFLRCEINVLQLESPDQVLLLFFIIFFLPILEEGVSCIVQFTLVHIRDNPHHFYLETCKKLSDLFLLS